MPYNCGTKTKLKSRPFYLIHEYKVFPKLSPPSHTILLNRYSTLLLGLFRRLQLTFCIKGFKDEFNNSPQQTFTNSKPEVEPVDLCCTS